MGGAVEGNSRDRRGQAVRNSSAVGMSSSSCSKVLSFQVRLPVDLCWRTVVSSLSSSEEKKSDSGWFEGVLGDSGWEGSCQLELFKVEMVVVCKGTMLNGKLDLLLCLVLGKGQAYPLGSRGFYTRDFLGKGQEFEDTP